MRPRSRVRGVPTYVCRCLKPRRRGVRTSLQLGGKESSLITDDAVTTEPRTSAGESSCAVLDARNRDVEALTRERWDVLVVGGGITGCGVLLDAASRGLRAALIERDDIAVGTSSRSSGLIHGGLRYLEQFQIGLVREALRERALLLRLAPHLVRLQPFLFPVYGGPWARPFFGAGLTAVVEFEQTAVLPAAAGPGARPPATVSHRAPAGSSRPRSISPPRPAT